jgi:hypothetical protein
MAAPHDDSEDLLGDLAERRLALRVPVFVALSVTDGLRRRHAELLDLSLTGARLRFGEPVTADRRPWLWIPAGLGGRLPWPVGCEVTWSESLSGAPTGHCSVGLRFRRFPPGAHRRLARALAELLARASEQAHARELPPPAERRESERVPYERRVIARGSGTPLVLLGRDLASGGLSVRTRRALAIGDRLQLALHAGGEVPLVVKAEVLRPIDDTTWALGFRDLSAAQRQRIETLLREQTAPSGAESSLLVSQLE